MSYYGWLTRVIGPAVGAAVLILTDSLMREAPTKARTFAMVICAFVVAVILIVTYEERRPER